MSYNGSGTFQINTSGQPVVTGTVISSSAFNALTADLATGLSTAITKDGQTATTVRIPFAQGINSSLTTDTSSGSTGSIFTAGGVGIAKALYVGTNATVVGTLGVTGAATFSATPIFSALTASSAVATDASKNLVSVTNTGTGNNVLATSPTLVTPVLGAASATSVTVAAGAVGTPSITTTGDTNTGIFFPAADTIAFAEGGAEAMRIDSSGNVGIGTSSPSYKLDITGSTARIYNDSAKLLLERPTNSRSGSISLTGSTGAIQYYAGNNGAGETSTVAHQFYSDSPSALSPLMTILGGGNVGIGTSSPSVKFQVDHSSDVAAINASGGGVTLKISNSSANDVLLRMTNNSSNFYDIRNLTSGSAFTIGYNGDERMRIDSSGNLLVGRTTGLGGGERLTAEAGGSAGLAVNRQNDDGNLVNFYQAGVNEGNISVSGTTVSYNGGHLSRWAQTATAKDNTLVKGTVLSNLDAMNVYTDADGNPVENEQLNKVKVSDVEGDANVAGVFVNWSYDDAHNVDEINMAMTGDMIIRIAQGTTVARGDLLMSAGNGTAKPQGDDIVRSKTVAKVTSTHVTCTYADGSYCVPCVLMAC